MLHIHTSNNLEYLIQALATVISSKPSSPFVPETIVVQSKGMERWVSMELARQLGAFAHGSFPFPNTMLWRVFKETLGHLPDTSPFEREVMVWSLMDILPDFLEQPEFSELSGYLQEDEQHIKRFQLAWRIADIFDQYVIYRPTWLADWELGRQAQELEKDSPAQWQALLWRALVERYGTQHQAKLRADFFNNVQRIAMNPRFQRISVFGISALPSFHLEVLAKLGQVIEVHNFSFNPCEEYWGDIVSDSEIAHKTAQLSREISPAENASESLEKATPNNSTFSEGELYFEKGNTLLASLGKMGRDFIDMLNEYPHESHEYFYEPGEATLLQRIQSDILHLFESGEDETVLIDVFDKSIQIHACHSPNREVEVLHDQLLALFEENLSLLPKDVLVMMPDIEIYAPFIEAVFATTPEESKRIPFTIADRSLRGESALIDVFFAILELSQSRFSVGEVLTVLEAEAVQKRFSLEEQDLDLIRHWINKVGIRWGMDGAAKERMNLPAFEENTWRAGLKRLLLGYALLGEGESSWGVSTRNFVTKEDFLFQGILPYDDIEGGETLVLGKLLEFIEQLFAWVQELAQPRTLPDWAIFLNQMLARFLNPNEEAGERQAQQVRDVLNTLVANAERAQFTTEVSREVILAYLRKYLETEPSPTKFLTGSVSFCSMLHSRSIPFKVVCLLGMDDQAYPRSNKPLGFDLIAKNPRRGDRSRRQNDRYLFLEVLLAARENFYISYVGQSIHDNTLMPPSVLVSELLDYISKGFTHPYHKISNYLVTQHPLQAFSPRYFNGMEKRLFSFSTEYCTASTVLLNERQEATAFISEPLPQPLAEWKTVDINRLTRFFKNPLAFLLKERLGIELQTDDSSLDETEPFTVAGLERYNLNQTLVEKSLAGMDLQEYQAIAKAGGQLPHGQIGDYIYSQLTGHVQPFVERVKQALHQEKREAITINMVIGDMRITGHLGRLWRDNLVHYRCAKLKAKDYIQLWIHHLILNSLPNNDLPRHSLLLGEDGGEEYQPVNNSKELLQTLLTSFYWQGIMQPLHFFPESSLTFVKNLQKGKNVEEAFYQAQNQWRGSDFKRGEAEDEYYQLCFGTDSMPLDESFKTLAQQFFEPLLAHIQPLS